jgi:multidrug efflux pump subunit AcrA (membrane-fusion protein)
VGTWQAEVSHFLVDANAGGDPREQLAQQLLAFIFNARHRLDDPGAVIQLPDGSWVSAQSLIDQAIAAWESGTAAEQEAIKSLLDGLNNSDAVPFIHFYPCEVVY